MNTKYLKRYTDEELIDGCISGDKHYQKALFDTFSPKMFGLCLRYSGEYHTAEDLLQEGFIKVFRNIHKFRREGSFEGWVRRIFVNTAIEHYRKSVHMYPIQDHEHLENDHYDDSTLDELLVQDIMKLVAELSPGYRTVFNLYIVEGYSHKDIAQMLKISEGTSKSQLARARYILQTKIKEIYKLPAKISS